MEHDVEGHHHYVSRDVHESDERLAVAQGDDDVAEYLLWDRQELTAWLRWCVDEYGLSSDLPEKFTMNGKGLHELTKDDFRARALDGDVIYNLLHQRPLAKPPSDAAWYRSGGNEATTATSSAAFDVTDFNRRMTDSERAVGMNAMMLAVKKGDTTTIRKLLRDDFQSEYVTQADSNGWNVFHYVAAYDNRQTILPLFVDIPTSLLTSDVLDRVNNDHETPLQVAVRFLREETALGLLVLGANANTALHTAAQADSPYLLKLLIAFGAEVNLVIDGVTPLQKVHESKTTRSKDEMIKVLEDVGAKVSSERDIVQQTDFQVNEEPVIETFGDRVISLDGGGIRGLVEILILQAIESTAGRPIIDCFDWFGGTSTGGILALAIANGCTLRYCLGLYMKLKDQVFVSSKPYPVQNLEKFLQLEFGVSKDMAELTGPRVVVTSVIADSIPAKLCLFRNYEKPSLDLCTSLLDEKEYEVTLHTGNELGAGTDANIRITLFGRCGKKALQSPVIELGRSDKSRNQVDRYNITTTNCGRLTKIRVELYGGGYFASWYLDCIFGCNFHLFTPNNNGYPRAVFTASHLGGQVKVSACIRNCERFENREVKFGLVVVVTDRANSRWKYFFPCEQWLNAPDKGQHTSIEIEALSKVWQAARATSAAPTYFKAFHHHLDGGLIANNPTLDLMTEIERYYTILQAEMKLDVVVSLGTGLFDEVQIDHCDIYMPRLSKLLSVTEFVTGAKNFVQVLLNEVTEPNGRAVNRSASWCRSLKVPYYRLNPEFAEGVELDCKDNKKLVNMLYETQRYIFNSRDQIKQLADKIRRKPVDVFPTAAIVS